MIRFTAWMSSAEHSGLKQLAQEHNTSVNYFIRIAVRRLLKSEGKSGLPPADVDVTPVTRNK